MYTYVYIRIYVCICIHICIRTCMYTCICCRQSLAETETETEAEKERMKGTERMNTKERLKLASSLAQSEPSEASLTAEEVLHQCKCLWGITAQLKPHQAQGVSWLIRCYLRGFNVMLGM